MSLNKQTSPTYNVAITARIATLKNVYYLNENKVNRGTNSLHQFVSFFIANQLDQIYHLSSNESIKNFTSGNFGILHSSSFILLSKLKVKNNNKKFTPLKIGVKYIKNWNIYFLSSSHSTLHHHAYMHIFMYNFFTQLSIENEVEISMSSILHKK